MVILGHGITAGLYYDQAVMPTITVGSVKIEVVEVFAMICSVVVLARI